MQRNEIWRDNYTGGKYRILEVEKDFDGTILNIKIQNINAGAIYDLGEWELKNNYTCIDSYSKAKIRG